MSKSCKILIVLIPILVGLSVFISCHPERVFSYGVRNMYHWIFNKGVRVEYWEEDIQIWKQGHCKIHLVSDKTGYYNLQCFINLSMYGILIPKNDIALKLSKLYVEKFSSL